MNSRAPTSFASNHDHVTCLRLGLTQLRSQPGITGGPFCAFLHGLGRPETDDDRLSATHQRHLTGFFEGPLTATKQAFQCSLKSTTGTAMKGILRRSSTPSEGQANHGAGFVFS